MTEADHASRRRPRWGVVALVALIHVVLIAGLIRAFTPELASSVVQAVGRALTVTVTTPPPPSPSPSPAPLPSAAPARPEGQAAPAGKRATPRDASVPQAPVVLRPTQAPPVAGKGAADAAGAAEAGSGTGAGGTGIGTGAGDAGTGQGGGGAGSPTVKIAGDIHSARDYPRASRDLRIGASVTIDLTVDVDGGVKACRIVQPSPDPVADRVTCDLATRRFRFRPARDSFGRPMEAIYRWRQRWFY